MKKYVFHVMAGCINSVLEYNVNAIDLELAWYSILIVVYERFLVPQRIKLISVE